MEALDRFNAGSHLVGLVGSVAVASVGLWTSWTRCDWLTLCGLAAFALTTAMLYAASTLCHSTAGRLRRLWERADQCAIFLLIAGTYTPFALTAPRHTENLVVLALLWVAAIRWLADSLRSDRSPDVRRLVLLGWFAVLAAVPVAARADAGVLALLLGGAAAYSLGTFFYVRSDRWPLAHGVWHVLVIAGTASHFGSILRLLA